MPEKFNSIGSQEQPQKKGGKPFAQEEARSLYNSITPDYVDRSETRGAILLTEGILKQGDSTGICYDFKNGEEIHARGIVAIENLDNLLSSEKRIKYMTLLLVDAKGQPVSSRKQEISLEKANGKPQIVVEGYITTIEKNKQYSTVTDNMLVDTLETMANKYGFEVIWKVVNANLEDLEEMEPGTPEYIAKAREQKAWQHLYGNGGKFQLKEIAREDGEKEWRRLFVPNEAKPSQHTTAFQTKQAEITMSTEIPITELEQKLQKTRGIEITSKASQFNI